MHLRKHLVTGMVATAFLGGTLALAPAAQAGTALATGSGTSQSQPGAAAACYQNSSIGWYCGFYKGSAYTDKGDTGKKVKEIQKLINDTAFGPGKPANIKVDGKFGSKTVAHVKWFQKTFMGKKAADGIVGPKTWKKLRDK